MEKSGSQKPGAFPVQGRHCGEGIQSVEAVLIILTRNSSGGVRRLTEQAMACFGALYGFRYATRCFNCAHAQQSHPSRVPAGGKLGVISISDSIASDYDIGIVIKRCDSENNMLKLSCSI